MKKIIYKTILSLIIILLLLVSYLSIIGLETDRFNNQIVKKINDLNQNIEVELKEIKLILEPFKLNVKAKTLGSTLKSKNGEIDIESIETYISLRSLLLNNFSLSNLEISTKSVDIKKIIAFVREINKDPKLFILENFIKKGYLIADINLEFDEKGQIKDNYQIKGFIRDGRVELLKKYKFNKINLIFDINKKFTNLEEIGVTYNSLDLFFEKLDIKNINNEFLFDGVVNNKNFKSDEENINKIFYSNIFGIKRINLSSKNTFSFKINKRFKFQNFKLNTVAEINELILKNKFQLKNILPNVKDEILLKNHKLEINYNYKKGYFVKGEGNILLQDEEDYVSYQLKNEDGKSNFETLIKTTKNPIVIDFLNFKKNQEIETRVNIKGFKDKNNFTKLNYISIKDKKNLIEIKEILLNNENRIMSFSKGNFDYLDIENKKNIFEITNKKNNYLLAGKLFNANNLIDKSINSDEKKNYKFSKDKIKIKVSVDKIRLDNKFNVKDLKGSLSFKDEKIVKADLNGVFSNNKELKLTINTNGNEKVTTIFSGNAEPFIKRYKFIKGFEEGVLDYNSVKNLKRSSSTLKIYDFKIKETTVLTKLLTLASLQGIADLLSGEGIRFDEFEMNFEDKDNLISIKEVYSIGPAISLLMEGYIEKKKLVSLRGTLVPATTINKAIGSIPILGKILVGSKTGEGVFGVSFKIKGPPKNPETTVNPIKTLTPRFITRTLERIKKSN